MKFILFYVYEGFGFCNIYLLIIMAGYFFILSVMILYTCIVILNCNL
jgi:hypothetical protein